MNAKGQPGAFYVWDSVPGFGVRVYPSGHKTFVVKYRNQFGKQRWKTLGAFPEVSTSAARKAAEEIRGEVRSGSDPKRRELGLRDSISIPELFNTYLEQRFPGVNLATLFQLARVNPRAF